MIAFAILTGARDNAMASLSLAHVDLSQRMVFQDPRAVRTKASKAIRTWFFPIGGQAEKIVVAWVAELRNSLGWGDDEPLFPATDIGLDANRHFAAVGLRRVAWSNADPIRSIFRRAFESAGLPYFNPHSFRKTLARLGEQLCRSPEEFKAWSQNLGHEQVLTTFRSYGEVPPHRQGEIIMSIGQPQDANPLDDPELAAVLRRLVNRAAA